MEEHMDEETRQFVENLKKFAMGLPGYEPTHESTRQGQTKIKLELIKLFQGDVEQVQLLLNVFERCEQIADAIQKDPSVIKRQTVNPFHVLARTIYGDSYDELPQEGEREEILGRIEGITNTFITNITALSPEEIKDEGLDGTDLFKGVMDVLQLPDGINHDTVHDLALSYFNAAGGIYPASPEQLM